MSPVPVLTTHRDLNRFKIGKILIALDLSGYIKPMMRAGETLAKVFDSQITLLNVRERGGYEKSMWLSDEAIEAFRRVESEFHKNIAHMIEGHLDQPATQTTIEVVKAGHAYEGILDYAQTADSDLIVMAPRGYSRFEYFWSFGSNTEKVVRQAPCPVLTFSSRELAQAAQN